MRKQPNLASTVNSQSTHNINFNPQIENSTNSDYYVFGKLEENAERNEKQDDKAKLTCISETQNNSDSCTDMQSTKLRFLDKLAELSTRNDKESNVLKAIFNKNYNDATEKAKTFKNIMDGSKEGTFTNYYKKLNKEQKYHRDWVINSKYRLKTSQSRTPSCSQASKDNRFTAIESSDKTSAGQGLQFSSVVTEKLRKKDKEYGSKIMNSIFSNKSQRLSI